MVLEVINEIKKSFMIFEHFNKAFEKPGINLLLRLLLRWLLSWQIGNHLILRRLLSGLDIRFSVSPINCEMG